MPGLVVRQPLGRAWDGGARPVASGKGSSVRKIVQRRIRRQRDGVDVAADVNAVVATNTGGGGGRTTASSRQRVQVVQRKGTEATERRTKSC